MSALNVTYPVKAGSIRACLHISTETTDWQSLTSSDFKDSVSGSAVAAGLRFAFIGVINTGTSTAYLKLRAADAVDDPTTNELPISASSVYEDDVATLRDAVTSIAIKKGATTDDVVIIAGFDKE
jgi:hypothetical protein